MNLRRRKPAPVDPCRDSPLPTVITLTGCLCLDCGERIACDPRLFDLLHRESCTRDLYVEAVLDA